MKQLWPAVPLSSDNGNPLDFVITWVDGEEAKHREKMRAFLSPDKAARDDVAGRARFVECGELYACVGSILRFASKVARRIILVTDDQTPPIAAWLQKYFLDAQIPVFLVDHKEIFEGYEQYLPVFNSISIETMLWRIPGLSDNYVCMNDDFMLVREVELSDFLPNGLPAAYTTPFPAWLVRLIGKFNGQKLTFKATMFHAADILGKACFEKLTHVPYTVSKTWFAENFDRLGLVRNLRHRFRDAEQVNTQSLFYTAALSVKPPFAERVSAKGKVVFLHCGSKKKDYLVKHLQRIDRTPSVRFACFNDVFLLSPSDLQVYEAWVREKIRIFTD